jgi:hypothetical protein
MRETAGRFTEAAGITVGNAVLYVANALHAAQLQEGLVSRVVIEQAKGVIMATEKARPSRRSTGSGMPRCAPTAKSGRSRPRSLPVLRREGQAVSRRSWGVCRG